MKLYADFIHNFGRVIKVVLVALAAAAAFFAVVGAPIVLIVANNPSPTVGAVVLIFVWIVLVITAVIAGVETWENQR